ncbi:MAG: DUF4242 domain-containing protein [Terrimonas sp.]|nr:DUF4242 domain-containing protein [Terrimonas sp.]
MPIYMDVHIVPGVRARDVAEAHRLDLIHQHEHHCKCMTYWIDEERENIFCLIEAPDKKAVENMHRDAHGLIPHKIIEVDGSLVESFLGRIYDPEDAVITDDGLKVFKDSSFRVLLVVKTMDPVLLKLRLGPDEAGKILKQFNEMVRTNIQAHKGREAEHRGTGFISSFATAKNAVACALAIQSAFMSAGNPVPGLRMGLNGGEPVEKKDHLFGDTIQQACYLCSVARDGQIIMSSAVKELIHKEYFVNQEDNLYSLAPQEEKLLEQLFNKLEENWQDPEFDMAEYCQTMAMSKSQLYRKAVSLTGISPNLFLKDFRLDKAKDLMKKKHFSISQITFDTGFTSPSYFTKCFKKKYGILPLTYMNAAHA